MSESLKSKTSYLSQKDLWFKVFIASLHRVEPQQALKDADEAVNVCNCRWSGPQPMIGSISKVHDYPVGTSLPEEYISS